MVGAYYKKKQFENVRSKVISGNGGYGREMIVTVICDGWGILQKETI